MLPILLSALVLEGRSSTSRTLPSCCATSLKVTSTLLTFQGHWRLHPVNDIQEYANDLNDWYGSNYNAMMGAYDEQKQLADHNRQRQKGKGKGGDKGKSKGKR